MIGQVFHATFGFTGATLLLLAMGAIGLSLFSGVSWLELMEAIGRACEWAWFKAIELWQRRADRKAGEIAVVEREIVVEAEKKRVEDHAPIRIEAPVREIPKSERVIKEKQAPLFHDLPDTPLPPLALLDEAPPDPEPVSAETLEFTSRLIEKKLKDFGVEVKVLAAYPGPVITRYEIEPAVGVKGSQVVNLVKDLARALSVVSIRVVETIPGKSCMGLEIPNPRRQTVRLTEILGSKAYHDLHSPLTLALGKDIGGHPVVADLARMPHLLVAGTTGSGKSVALNAMILSLLYKAEPRDVRMVMVDPKMLELSVYQDIPHLLAPVVTDMKQAASALMWCIGEMERRYKLMSWLGVRNLSGFNHKVAEAEKRGEKLAGPEHRRHRHPGAAAATAAHRRGHRRARRPDDGGREEGRGADRAPRAEGARRRHPSPRRDPAPVGRRHHRPHQGEHPHPDRVPGVVEGRLAHHPRPAWRGDAARAGRHALSPARQPGFRSACTARSSPTRRCTRSSSTSSSRASRTTSRACSRPTRTATRAISCRASGGGESDTLYDQAVEIVMRTRRPSISLVQRHLRIGYNRAARLLEQMEQAGLVSSMQTNGNREVLVPNRAE